MINSLRIKEILLNSDIDAAGIASAEPFSQHRERVKELIQAGKIPDRNLNEIEENFYNPGNLMPKVKSILTAAECYLTSEPADPTVPGKPRGTIARYTWRNYYWDLYQKLETVSEILRREFEGYAFQPYCGARKLPEKLAAAKSGLGFYGKNGIVMTSELGSWMVLGEILTDLEIEPETGNWSFKLCGNCRMCLDICPTKALTEPGVLDKNICLQYLMNWEGIFPFEIREVWGSRLYGCTTCQDACPRNQKIKPKERIFELGFIGSSIPLLEILQLDESGYREKYKANQMGQGWIKRECIQRNAIVALGNIADSIAVPALAEILENGIPMLRAHAAWSLGKIGGDSAKSALEKQRGKEDQPEVKREIEIALEII